METICYDSQWMVDWYIPGHQTLQEKPWYILQNAIICYWIDILDKCLGYIISLAI